MAENVAFFKEVTRIRKATSAATDLLRNMNQRIIHINQAAQDMPVEPKGVLEKSYALSRQFITLNMQLNGDATKTRREFETTPSINDRVGGIEYAIWNSTAPVPKMYKESYEIASRQFKALLTEMKELNKKLEELERELEINQAPYTPGRWPEWR
jgi:uncharacterized protein YukE